MESLQERLLAEQNLRILAERKSSLIQMELEQLQRKLQKHNIQSVQLEQTVKESQIELELRKTITSADQVESSHKIQKLIDTLKKDQQISQTELKQLTEINRALLRNSAFAKSQQEQLLMQIADLKKKFKERRPIDELNGLIIKEEDSLINSEERNQKKSESGYEQDEDIQNLSLQNSLSFDDGEEESDRFLQLYERHRIVN